VRTRATGYGWFDYINVVAFATGDALAGNLNPDGFVGQADLDIVLAMWGTSHCEWRISLTCS